ncbi:hypothetical protein U1Q18_021164 [Sarracenia purpurea var. burkii]
MERAHGVALSAPVQTNPLFFFIGLHYSFKFVPTLSLSLSQFRDRNHNSLKSETGFLRGELSFFVRKPSYGVLILRVGAHGIEDRDCRFMMQN